MTKLCQGPLNCRDGTEHFVISLTSCMQVGVEVKGGKTLAWSVCRSEGKSTVLLSLERPWGLYGRPWMTSGEGVVEG
jgi:hypothetical protein